MKARGGWRSRNPSLANALAAAIAALLVGFGVYGVLRDDFSVRLGKRHYYHFHGAAAWLMAAGFVCLGASVAVVVLHRLKARPGEKTDQRLAAVMGAAGAFIILAMMVLKSAGLV